MTDIVPEPELIMKHHGVTIYHCYNLEHLGDNHTYLYGCSPDSYEKGEEFNIRELPNYRSGRSHVIILIDAIDKGYLSQEGGEFGYEL